MVGKHRDELNIFAAVHRAVILVHCQEQTVHRFLGDKRRGNDYSVRGLIVEILVRQHRQIEGQFFPLLELPVLYAFLHYPLANACRGLDRFDFQLGGRSRQAGLRVFYDSLLVEFQQVYPLSVQNDHRTIQQPVDDNFLIMTGYDQTCDL